MTQENRNSVISSGASSFSFLLPILPSICYTDGVFNAVSEASRDMAENTHTRNRDDVPPVANSRESLRLNLVLVAS